MKDRDKTRKGIKKGFMSFKKILPMLIPMFLIVGVGLTYITPEMIQSVMGKDSGILGVLIGLVMGSIAFMPPFVTFPLGAELIQQGAGLAQVAALVTTLMGVGVVYMQVEIKHFGAASMIRRNMLAVFAAIAVALVVGVTL
ncbi:MAG: permease [Spirochaetales bacterium]|nr:permease [Spirochaetales bacterium]